MGHDQEVTISCAFCSVNVPIAQTTYNLTGKELICFNCYNKLAKGKQPDKVMQSEEAPEKISYNCTYCSFQFSRARSFEVSGRCVNCGRHSLKVEETNQIILRDRKSLLDY